MRQLNHEFALEPREITTRLRTQRVNPLRVNTSLQGAAEIPDQLDNDIGEPMKTKGIG